MDTQIGGDLNELMSTKMCSPMMIYLGIVIITGVSVYLTRNSLMKHNTNKMDNLYNLYSGSELRFIILFGLVLFGLCQYNKTQLAWLFLLVPVIYIILQNLIVHIHVSSAIQSAPKLLDLNYVQQQVGMGGGKIVPQDSQQMPVEKKEPVTQSTSISQPLGNNISGNTVNSNPGIQAYNYI
tara:strand:- start:74 stop:616 length:543 start_codon:yes stop_codon:yes gene_type:complete